MQNTNDQEEVPPADVAASSSEKTDRPIRRSNLRPRSARNSGQSTGVTTTESIGEIQPTPGETLEDDLTVKSNAARAKGGNRGNDSRDDRGPGEGQERNRGERRTRQSEGGGRGRRRHDTRESGRSERQERSENEEKSEHKSRGEHQRKRERSRRGNREKEKSSGRGERSRQRRPSDSESSDESKTPTYDPRESQKEEGFFGKAGKLLKSIFGESKQKPKGKSRRKPEGTQNQGNKRRRGRRKHSRGDRGGQARD